MTHFSLNRRERRFLEGFVTCPAAAESCAARKPCSVSRQTAYNWWARFSAR
jgi:hypothetical protein